MTFPSDFDIFRPSESRIRLWQYTSLKGTFPVRCSDSMIIRATQKNRISQPVSSTDVGKSVRISSVSLGQPSVLNGQRPELNQVSRLSSSRTRVNFWLGNFASAF